MPKAVIYCRVSSDRQAKEGHGIEGQERHCRRYAEGKGYEVARVFKDEGISGGILDRPGMEELLDYLGSHKKDGLVVVVDDLKRLARDVVTHFQLKKLITSRNATLESPTHSIEDTPEGKFMETIFAATAELERNQNKKQVLRRMKARMEAGYWTFYPPPGYAFATDPRHGKIIVPKEPEASVIRAALEGFASGRLPTQLDVQQFLRSKGFKHRQERGRAATYPEQVRRLLTREVYAGFIHYPKWDVTRRRGHHQPLVSGETFDRIQERLREKAYLPHRRDLCDDFPLRGFVLCSRCEKPLTGAWTQGRNRKFAYYRCKTLGCPLRSKSVQANRMHTEFEGLLKRLRPRDGILQVVRAELLGLWEAKWLDVDSIRRERQRKLDGIQKEIDGYLEAIQKCHNPTVLARIEEAVEALEAKKLRLGGSIKKPEGGEYDFETSLGRVMGFVQNPHGMWASGDLRQRRLVLRLVFEKPLSYVRGEGFATASFSLPIAVSCVPELDEMEVVDTLRTKFEPLCVKLREMAEQLNEQFSRPDAGLAA